MDGDAISVGNNTDFSSYVANGKSEGQVDESCIPVSP